MRLCVHVIVEEKEEDLRGASLAWRHTAELDPFDWLCMKPARTATSGRFSHQKQHMRYPAQQACPTAKQTAVQFDYTPRAAMVPTEKTANNLKANTTPRYANM